MKTIKRWPTLILLALVSVQSPSMAEEFDEDADLEDFFSIRQKSTLSDFPLQEIAAEELSNAAIEGALQANTNIGTKAKPIYLEEKEQSDKKRSGDTLKENQLELDDSQKFGQIQIIAPQFQEPIYQQDTGRVYSGHHTSTVERP